MFITGSFLIGFMLVKSI